MEYTNNLYEGGSYGLEPPAYSKPPKGYQVAASTIGLATDSRTANQAQEVLKKLRTGAKTIEVSPSLEIYTWDSIPKQQFKEINRLKKLAGVDLTLHGPMVEPSGFNPRGGAWDELQRIEAENQLKQAVERGHELDPNGNLVITFHSAYSFPETQPKVFKKGEKEPTLRGIYVINEESGRTAFVPAEEKKLLGKKLKPDEILSDYNESNWSATLEGINRELILSRQRLEALEERELEEKGLHALKLLKEDRKKFDKYVSEFTPEQAKLLNMVVERLSESEIDVRDAYNRLNEAFNIAYKSAYEGKRQQDLAKLEELREGIGKTIESNKKNPLQFIEFRNQVSEGLKVLGDISAPNIVKPLKNFVLDKGAETYASVAYNAYKKFKDKAPIISIENPPAGTAISTGEDLKEMIETIRKKFVEKAVSEGELSKSEAEKQANKLIGATWDVGHINMLRKYGYEEKHIIEETKKIAPFVKHVHLSDNFGMEHTELPMGMGNVPYEKMLEIINKFNDKAKKISETGGAWYQFFKKEPLLEQLSTLNSPIYSQQLAPAPTWEQSRGMMASYFGGIGNVFPEQHFGIYGAGFGTTAPELGGQLGRGDERSRFTGAPTE